MTIALLSLALSGLAAACGGSTHSAAVAGRVGDLEIIHPFLPDPASPSVAAVYLTVRDTGSVPDRLVAASSDVATSAMLMSEQPAGTMAPLTDLAVPAHGEASLVPGHDHLMLENPKTSLRVGQTVAVTLRFARAGAITLEVPVVPLDDILSDGSSGASNPGSGTMGNMPGMKGM